MVNLDSTKTSPMQTKTESFLPNVSQDKEIVKKMEFMMVKRMHNLRSSLEGHDPMETT